MKINVGLYDKSPIAGSVLDSLAAYYWTLLITAHAEYSCFANGYKNIKL